ncbi:hypothetical protein [Streptomyces sp. NPDC001137]|uniref:hypothetical protein n=1 Tax=Streptomyces sp. NPDC001137 TaxID=3154378 RepID=UPI0033195ABE
MVADAELGDLESIAAAVLDDGEYSAAFQEAIDSPVGDLLILDRVFLARPWRGFGLGPVFAAEAIRRLFDGCCAVAAEPGMAEWPDNRDEVSDADRTTAKAKVAALWESIGFHAFHGGVQLLDTSLQEPLDLHRARRKDLEVLSAAYQAHLHGRPHHPEPATTPLAGTRQPTVPAPAAQTEPRDWLAAATSLVDLEGECEFSGWSHSDRATALAVAAQATHDTDLRQLAAASRTCTSACAPLGPTRSPFPGTASMCTPSGKTPRPWGRWPTSGSMAATSTAAIRAAPTPWARAVSTPAPSPRTPSG